MPTIVQSLGSILTQIDSNFEVVVVDQGSTDGSYEYLKSLSDKGQIKLVKQKVRNRGLGRQKAFEESSGQYIVAGMDMDDFFEPNLREIMSIYHQSAEGIMLRVLPGPVTIAPRSVIQKLGGWVDLNRWEDYDIWEKAFHAGLFRWMTFPLCRINHTPKAKKEKLSALVNNYRECFRVRARKSILFTKKNMIRFFPFLVAGWIEAQFSEAHPLMEAPASAAGKGIYKRELEIKVQLA
jgi:glycosyltransferase involved in cell wall biosynthesis